MQWFFLHNDKEGGRGCGRFLGLVKLLAQEYLGRKMKGLWVQ